MAEMHQSSDSDRRALPVKVNLPQITGLTTAFPMEVETQSKPASPHRAGDDAPRKPKRHGRSR